MALLADLRSLTTAQRATLLASFLGWTLDAFDFFLMVFVLKAIAHDFNTGIKAVSHGIFLTLACRPIGALLFGWLAEKYGRKPILMLDILCFAVIELASAFAPTLEVLLVLRALFGIAMGGEWGIGTALAMETIPARLRGLVSGFLQEGYAVGYLLAAIVYGLLFNHIGWRGMFLVGALPALLVIYIRLKVPESPAWEHRQQSVPVAVPWSTLLIRHGRLFLYLVLVMTAFAWFSHGTQDLYPTFLQEQRHLSAPQVSLVLIIANIGAIIGGISFGALSERWGRRRTIAIAALFVIPMIPLWSLGSSPVHLALGAFLVQIGVQGAWGVVPAYLNELSPPALRAVFPSLAYQLGNLLASYNAVLQAGYAQAHEGNFAFALALTALLVAVAIISLIAVGPEAKGIDMHRQEMPTS